MSGAMEGLVESLDLSEEEVQERLKQALGEFSVEDFLTDIMLFDYLIKNNGVVTITQDDIEKIEEIRSTRAIEFMSELDEDNKRIMIARLIYTGEEKENEEVSNDN